MAYNFCVVQRLSDGKYLTNTGGWDNLNFTDNYSKARFYYSDADDVSDYIGGYPIGDYRVIEYWMPGSPTSNRPFSNSTVLGNFMGSLYSANSVIVNAVDYRGVYDRCVVTTTDDYNGFLADWNIAGGVGGYLVITDSQNDNYGFRGTIPASEVSGMPRDYFDGFWAMAITNTNSTTTSSGYRRIVFSGVFSSAPYSGEEFKYVFTGGK
jgi:hypothetical protein